MTNKENYHFKSHEEGDLKYFEMGRTKEEDRQTGRNAMNAAEIANEELKRKAMTIILVFLLATSTVIAGKLEADVLDTNIPKDQKKWEDTIESTLSDYEDLQHDYSKDGSTITVTSNGYHYKLEDTDNDTYIESGTVVVSGGKSAEYSDKNGRPIHYAMDQLDSAIARAD